ncbi:hypothetical protein M3899_003252 [Vibrio parahaemolyticus]|nr:hypothetical protein [Vibrio parahaemolyticus]
MDTNKKILGTTLITTALLIGCSSNPERESQFTITTNHGVAAHSDFQTHIQNSDLNMTFSDKNGIEYKFENPEYSLNSASLEMVGENVSKIDYRVFGAGNFDEFTMSVEVGECHEVLSISLEDRDHHVCDSTISIGL